VAHPPTQSEKAINVHERSIALGELGGVAWKLAMKVKSYARSTFSKLPSCIFKVKQTTTTSGFSKDHHQEGLSTLPDFTDLLIDAQVYKD
jgi:hypothetical protein